MNFRELADRAIALLYAMTFTEAAASKIGATPEWFVAQFQPTILGAVPGLIPLSYRSIQLGEAALGILFLFALFARHPVARTTILPLALLGSMLMFTALSFGSRISHQYETTGLCFVLAAISFFVLDRVRDKAA